MQAYRVIKSSACLSDPDQHTKICKRMDKFLAACGCGLEVVALRKTRKGRRRGSLEDLAKFLYRYIRSGGDNLTKSLNLTRPFPDLDRVKSGHASELWRRKAAAKSALHSQIDARRLDEHGRLTGLIVRTAHELLVLQHPE